MRCERCGRYDALRAGWCRLCLGVHGGRPRKRERCSRCDHRKRLVVVDGLCGLCAGIPGKKGGRRLGSVNAPREPKTLPPPKQRCKSCLYRYVQEHGLCRSCRRRLETRVESTYERESAKCDRKARELEELLAERRPVFVPARLVERTIAGVTFDVHDLAVRTLEPGEFERALAEARGIPYLVDR